MGTYGHYSIARLYWVGGVYFTLVGVCVGFTMAYYGDYATAVSVAVLAWLHALFFFVASNAVNQV